MIPRESPKSGSPSRLPAGGRKHPILVLFLSLLIQTSPQLQSTGGNSAGSPPSTSPHPDRPADTSENDTTADPLRSRNETGRRTRVPRNKPNRPSKARPRIHIFGKNRRNNTNTGKSVRGMVEKITRNSVQFRVVAENAQRSVRMRHLLFELRGLKGREMVRIDFVNAGQWSSLRSIVPLYSRNVDDLSHLSTLRVHTPDHGNRRLVKTYTGQIVPATRERQKWHYFKAVERNKQKRMLTVRNVFPAGTNHAYVTFTPPYTLDFHQNYMARLQERAHYHAQHLAVHEVKTTEGNHPVHVVERRPSNHPHPSRKPVVLVSAGVHPDEHASYQAIRGAISWFLSDTADAAAVRHSATVLFIPALNPDGLVKNHHDRSDRQPTGETPPSSDNERTPPYTAFTKWLGQRIKHGTRPDVHLVLHDSEPGKTDTHLSNMFTGPAHEPNDIHHALQQAITHTMNKNQFRVAPFNPPEDPTPNHPAGLPDQNSETLRMHVELNPQPRSPGRKLTLKETRQLGALLLHSTTRFLTSKKGRTLRQNHK